eukprot:TRINITY_DN16345_c0_g1_i1.p1 TRINITY_DN16345_c0_g1~~TRINITY_DN16345_c0_g1_i1.p1  ORF type:complete len:214 (-),score=22.02 TRINITY_DN16345_c0_g1_i1:269-910(-)
MEFLELTKNIVLNIIKYMDLKTILNLSICSKESLNMVESSLNKICTKHKYWIYFESCYLGNEILNKNWRTIKFNLDKFYDRWYLRAYKRNTNNFTFKKEIGEGSFSVVWEAMENNYDAIFAIKQVPKQQILREKKLEAIQREKDVLAKIIHPNIIRLFGTLVDEAHLYFILERCVNKDCAEMISKNGRIDVNCAQFYMAEIFTAINYLHSNNI